MRAELIASRSAGPFAKTLQWLRAVQQAWSRRRMVHQLASLDDHLLRDMGVTRQDVESVLADPGLEDPTLALAARARNARRSMRASAIEERNWMALLDQNGEAGATATGGHAAMAVPAGQPAADRDRAAMRPTTT